MKGTLSGRSLNPHKKGINSSDRASTGLYTVPLKGKKSPPCPVRGMGVVPGGGLPADGYFSDVVFTSFERGGGGIGEDFLPLPRRRPSHSLAAVVEEGGSQAILFSVEKKGKSSVSSFPEGKEPMSRKALRHQGWGLLHLIVI